MSRYLCTRYEGPKTWGTPLDEWSGPEDYAAGRIHDEEDAATSYAEACWDGDGDPTDAVKVAVRDAETGRRWVVTVYGEAVIDWRPHTSEEVEP